MVGPDRDRLPFKSLFRQDAGEFDLETPSGDRPDGGVDGIARRLHAHNAERRAMRRTDGQQARFRDTGILHQHQDVRSDRQVLHDFRADRDDNPGGRGRVRPDHHFRLHHPGGGRRFRLNSKDGIPGRVRHKRR